MINDNTILSSFNDRPTLLEWLKKVEDALKSDTATGVSVENPSVNSYVFKITFADGKTIASDTIRFPDSVKGASILNNHLILTMQSGLTDDLGVINPYADTIVSNSETNTTEIANNAVVDGNLQVNGNVLFGSSTISIQGTTKQNGILGTNADGKIAFKEISGGGKKWLNVNFNNTSGDETNLTSSATINEQDATKILNGEVLIIFGTYRKVGIPVKFYSVLQAIDGDEFSKSVIFKGTFNSDFTSQDLNCITITLNSNSTTLQANMTTII